MELLSGITELDCFLCNAEENPDPTDNSLKVYDYNKFTNTCFIGNGKFSNIFKADLNNDGGGR